MLRCGTNFRSLHLLFSFFLERHQALVNVANRVKALTRRNKPQLIYHYLNITRPYSTLNIQVKVDNPETSRLIVLGRYQSLPTLTKCDFIKPLIDVTDEDGNRTTIVLL